MQHVIIKSVESFIAGGGVKGRRIVSAAVDLIACNITVGQIEHAVEARITLLYFLNQREFIRIINIRILLTGYQLIF